MRHNRISTPAKRKSSGKPQVVFGGGDMSGQLDEISAAIGELRAESRAIQFGISDLQRRIGVVEDVAGKANNDLIQLRGDVDRLRPLIEKVEAVCDGLIADRNKAKGVLIAVSLLFTAVGAVASTLFDQVGRWLKH